ncbi:hypothetical protein EV148_103104 [Dokdonella fugitiva]|uniref:CHC2-type zinc finger protein n=2 Tax=Dokdonella fugitiva TaxID=328517 RepID=A0A4R2I9R8_9GAMM|nr:hypothetical protein EV148_103104 [Dokdonella fugitiva]
MRGPSGIDVEVSAPVRCATPLDVVLCRLVGARPSANGWRADCPVGHSSRGSLSICERDDGAVMLHCFAGCSAADVVASAGLTLANLFPSRPRNDSPEDRRAARAAFRSAAWGAALGVLAMESTVIEIAAETIARGEPMTPDDMGRVHLATNRIRDAREVLHGR